MICLTSVARERAIDASAICSENPEIAGRRHCPDGRLRWLAALIYGGGLRVSECCELRIKDLDFDQGLVVVRHGKGDKDRSTLLAELGQEELRAHLRKSEAQHQADRQAGLAGVWMPDACMSLPQPVAVATRVHVAPGLAGEFTVSALSRGDLRET
jgi:Phage integrase family